MLLRSVYAAAVLLLSVYTLSARPKQDVIYMKNGDRITCEIKRLSNGRLAVSIDYFDGTLDLDWSLVARVESTQGFTVETLEGELVSGKIQADVQEGKKNAAIAISSPTEYRQIETEEVATVRQDEQRWYQRIHGAANIGWIYTRANRQTQLAADGSLAYTHNKWDATADTNSNLSVIGEIQSANRTQNRFQVTRYFDQRWFAVGFGDFLKSAEQNLDLRSTYGGGLGKTLIRTPQTRLRVLGALVATQERYSQASGGAQQSTLEGALRGEYQFFTFKNANFFGSASLYPSFSNPGRYRVDTSVSTRVKLFKDVTINFSMYSNFDSSPPEGGQRSDYGANTGIGYTF